jgi:beta-mannosidase
MQAIRRIHRAQLHLEMPLTGQITRKETVKKLTETTEASIEISTEIQLWGCNSTLQEVIATVELVSVHLDEGELDRRTFDVTLKANQSTEIWSGPLPGQSGPVCHHAMFGLMLMIGQPIRTSRGQVPKPIVVQARLISSDKAASVLARYANWPEPYKFLIFPHPKLRINVQGDHVVLSCDKPVKGIVLDTEAEGGEEVQWSDQAIDLMPGDDQTIIATGLGGRKAQARYVGSEDHA